MRLQLCGRVSLSSECLCDKGDQSSLATVVRRLLTKVGVTPVRLHHPRGRIKAGHRPNVGLSNRRVACRSGVRVALKGWSQTWEIFTALVSEGCCVTLEGKEAH
jgi:hypothetical protein